MNDLIARGADLKCAVRGIENWEHQIRTQEDASHFLSFIDNKELQKLVIEKFIENSG
jgi:hypothetical protein